MWPFKPLLEALLIAATALVVAVPSYSAEIPDFTQLVENQSKAVVSINATGERGGEQPDFPAPPIPEDSPLYDYFKRFFEQLPEDAPRSPSPLSSIGSGFIISEDGYILTNAHVIQGTDTITVGLSDRNELSAKVVGKDERSDIALIKVETEENLPTVKIGNTNELQVGQWVLAIGSPFGFEHTATQGIISALGRSLPRDSYVPFIQTDAAVNPGNSGGPLFNLEGEVIGVNSQIYSRSGGYQGVSFAIPIDVAMDVAEQLRTQGKVLRGWLGVLIQEVTRDLARSFGLDKPRGALVGQVLEDSPAQKAGIQAGDIIIGFDDQTISHSSELPPMVGRTRPGVEAPLKIIRDGKQETLSVTIEELPDDPQRQAAAAEPALGNRLKLKVVDDPEVEEGVRVEEVKPGPAAQAGIQPGDILISLNKKTINSAEQFEQIVKDLPAGEPFPIRVQRGDGALFLALTIPQEKTPQQKSE